MLPPLFKVGASGLRQGSLTCPAYPRPLRCAGLGASCCHLSLTTRGGASEAVHGALDRFKVLARFRVSSHLGR
jgi:hypothetical protein